MMTVFWVCAGLFAMLLAIIAAAGFEDQDDSLFENRRSSLDL